MQKCNTCGLDKPLARYGRRTLGGKYKTQCRDCEKIVGDRRRSDPNYHDRTLNRDGKACTKCARFLPLTKFAASNTVRDGHDNRCRECVNATGEKLRAKFRGVHLVSGNAPVVSESYCPGCEETLPALDFHRCNSRKNGLATYCRLCMRSRQRGLSKAQFFELLLAQGNQCAVCKMDLVLTTTRRGMRTNVAAIDHDHETGLVRGILCILCNATLGLVRDNPEILRGLIRYLGHDLLKESGIA